MKKFSIKYLIIAVCSVILLAAVVLTIVFTTPTVLVPDVSSKHLVIAEKMLTESGLKVKTKSQYDDEAPKNTVMSQSLEAGSKVRKNSIIVLTLSAGVPQVTVPEVENINQQEAEQALQAQGFAVTVTEEFSDRYEKGRVISQSVTGGKSIDQGSTIALVVSKGPDLVQVPNVKGMTLKAATEAFENAGLNIYSDIKCSNTVKEGAVISQNIDAGEYVKRNSTISTVISAGKSNTVGNTNANLNNGGTVATQGNWVYYANTYYDYGLYKMRNDGSEKQLLSADTATAINVVGEWVYYTNENSSNGGIYKVRLDGTRKTKINSNISYWLYVADDWIYYCDSVFGGQLYKVRTDGTDNTKICSDECSYINISGDWIYYLSEGKAYKMRTDGSSRRLLHNEFEGNSLILSGNVLYMDSSYSYYTYKINTDGTGFVRYKEDRKQKTMHHPLDGWLYFVEHDFTTEPTKTAIYKTKFDNTQKTKVLDINYMGNVNRCLNISKGWIYFFNEDDNGYLYRVKTDGTKLQKVYN